MDNQWKYMDYRRVGNRKSMGERGIGSWQDMGEGYWKLSMLKKVDWKLYLYRWKGIEICKWWMKGGLNMGSRVKGN